MFHDMQMRQAKYEKKMMGHKHEQEAFARQQTITNRNIDDSLANLAASLRTSRPQAIPQTRAPHETTGHTPRRLRLGSTAGSESVRREPTICTKTVAVFSQQPFSHSGRVMERAEQTRQGICWWCPEKHSRAHVCAKKFYALMGVDDEDEEIPVYDDTNVEDDGENMAICGDVSRVLVLYPKIKPRSICLHGRINGSSVFILIDGGSTHNFIQPTVAEKLSLPINVISPFRVFAGDGASLKCVFACFNTPVTLQGHRFEIDLFIHQVKGPDIILGVKWLQDLSDITKNFRNLTMKFGDPSLLVLFTRPAVAIIDTIRLENSLLDEMCELQKLVAEGHASTHISVQDGIIHFKRRMFLTRDSSAIPAILADSPSCGTPVALPPELLQGHPLDTPVRAVEERTMLVDGVSQVQCLVHWASDVNGAPSWESAAQLVKDFPHLRLEDKLFGALMEKLEVAANDKDINSLAVVPRMEYKTKALPYSPVCSASTILMVEGGDDIRLIGIGSNVCMPLPQQNFCCLFANVESWHMESIRVGLVGHMGMLKRDNPDGLNLSAGYGACLS
ncbi:hypothetical protein SASPL_137571 [Salvia splendens]|uniref:Uncharacterized protein n=1 Tax=Salvia splendens TaxID=180675 RepID=A0A8X8WTW7_SALSN|nr:hypothetical protein SASPL_137571 [Salvia splendens]